MTAYFQSVLLHALGRHSAMMVTRAARAHDAARASCAQSDQRIIDSECRATKLSLAQDREAWRVYCRRQGLPAELFIPYVTLAPSGRSGQPSLALRTGQGHPGGGGPDDQAASVP